MKRNISPILLILLFVSIHLSADTPSNLRRASFPDLEWYDMKDDVMNKLLFKAKDLPFVPPILLWGDAIVIMPGPHQRVYHVQDIHIDEQGFRYFHGPQYKFVDGTTDTRYLVLAGAGWFVLSNYTEVDPKYYRFSSDGMIKLLEAKQRGIDRKSTEWVELPNWGFVDDGISNIRAWSALTQVIRGSQIQYHAENMRHPFVVATYDAYSFEYNQINPPWAEGVSGPGIGGTIDIEFTRSSMSLIILNGYVDFARRHLYKQNARPKTLKIESTNPPFSITATLEDVVQLREITFPAATAKVRLTILEVYKGTKYNDACISKIFIPQVELRSQAEYEAEVEKALKTTGYLK
jgi:hypothetical protein